MKPVIDLLVRTGLAIAVMSLIYRTYGLRAFVTCSPLVGVMLARPLLDAFAEVWRRLSGLALRRVQGRYVEWRGRPVDIQIDELGACWIGTADVRQFVALPSDTVLRRLCPDRCSKLGDPPIWRIRHDALAELLAKATRPETTKFVHWLEKAVAEPARKRALVADRPRANEGTDVYR